MLIQITDRKIDESATLESVKSELAGACVLFVGTTRKLTDGKETTTLRYDSYLEMAEKKLQELRIAARDKWPLCKCAIVHRVGEVPIGETSVAVATSSPHRVDSFEAASWIMDTLKKEIPIWKQEVWADGTEEWVHPVPESKE
ncbi:MAG: molybdenum cofactor biosynthesis protein MoaE [Planctomycetota bacterium]